MDLTFSAYLLKESKQDVINICEKLAENVDPEMHWDMLASIMEQVGNDLKAQFIRTVIDGISRDQNPASNDQRFARKLIESGLKGFCCPDGPQNFDNYMSGKFKPMLGATAHVGWRMINCRIPVHKSIVESAIASQMGVSQFFGKHVSPEQLDLGAISIVRSYQSERRASDGEEPETLPEVLEVISRIVTEDLKSKSYSKVWRHHEPDVYFFVEQDIENYPAMIVRTSKI